MYYNGIHPHILLLNTITMTDGNQWFIAVVTPNTEKSCRDKLDKLFEILNKEKKYDESEDEDKKVISYVPIQRELHEWPSTGKRVWVDKILCPCYVFIRCSDRDRYDIACRAKFILHFLMDRARKNKEGRSDLARIPNSQMETFRRMVGDAEHPVSIDPSKLHLGSKVRVKSGRFEGMEGYLYREPNGSSMIAVVIDFLGCAKTEYPIELLELVEK